MQYIKYNFTHESLDSEVVIALISNIPFEAFEEFDKGCSAYIQSRYYNPVVEADIQAVAEQFKLAVSTEDMPIVNWNKTWESNFDPIIIDDICTIYAAFHKIEISTLYAIKIAPKMAFGTGHHATTYMMIAEMNKLDFKDTKVFDYGCGTAILSVFAEKLGAKSIFGIDIEAPAVENSIEHATINNCNNVSVKEATLELIDTSETYDVILANINLNVILASLNTLNTMLNDDGTLLLSGILKKDKETLFNHPDFKKFSVISIRERNNWLCIRVTK